MDDWQADVEAEPLPDGGFAPVIVLVPPTDVGPPIRRVLSGCFTSEEHAKWAALDAFAAMSRGEPEAGD